MAPSAVTSWPGRMLGGRRVGSAHAPEGVTEHERGRRRCPAPCRDIYAFSVPLRVGREELLTAAQALDEDDTPFPEP